MLKNRTEEEKYTSVYNCVKKCLEKKPTLASVQEAIEREFTMEFRPAEQFTDERAPIIFNIPKQNRDFTDLRRCSMK